MGLKIIEKIFYISSFLYLVIAVLGLTFKELTVDLWVFSASGDIDNPGVIPVLLLIISTLGFLIVFSSRLSEMMSNFRNILSSNYSLLRMANDEVRDKTGKSHPVSNVSILGLLNPTANLGVWMTSKGGWSAPIVLAISPITYIWLSIVSFIKVFIINGGFYKFLLPLIFVISPLSLYLYRY
jgi:hypothetical protein